MVARWLLFVVVLCGWTLAPRKLVKTKLNSQIRIALPKELVAVSSDVASERYPSVRKSLGIFANADYTVDFGVHTSATYWPDENLEIAQQFFKSSIYNLYGSVDWISEGTRKMQGKHYIYFEFNARVSRGAHETPVGRYVYVQYLIESDATLTFSFSCVQSLERDWQETARSMMTHIRVK